MYIYHIIYYYLNEGLGLNKKLPGGFSKCWLSKLDFPMPKNLCVDDLGLTQFYENITMGIKQRFCIFAKKVLTILLWFLLFPQLLQVF